MIAITKEQQESNSTIRKVNTSVGTFTIFFKSSVSNPDDPMQKIPQIVENFHFALPKPDYTLSAEDQRKQNNAVHDRNAFRLQLALNKGVKFGTCNPVCIVDMHYATREIFLL